MTLASVFLVVCEREVRTEVKSHTAVVSFLSIVIFSKDCEGFLELKDCLVMDSASSLMK